MQKAHNAVTKDDETKDSFLRQCTALSKAFAMVSPHKEANDIRDDVLFFQSVRRSIRRYTPSARDVSEDVDTAIKQLVQRAFHRRKLRIYLGSLRRSGQKFLFSMMSF